MPAYYNEIDPFSADWLRRLIAGGVIPDGVVDQRSITEVKPDDLKEFNQCHFFAGLGGWAYALRLAGVSDDAPIWTGSCPCQPFSAAGMERGLADDRHLWPSWFALIQECRPELVFGEQVDRAAKHGWLDEVSTSLEGEGYAVGATVLPATAVGAWHRRARLWFVAHPIGDQQPRSEPCRWTTGRVGRVEQPVAWDRAWESALSEFRAVDDGLPRRVAATDAARNAIVPQTAAVFVSAALDAITGA